MSSYRHDRDSAAEKGSPLQEKRLRCTGSAKGLQGRCTSYARFLQNKSSNPKQVDMAMNEMVCQ